MVVYLLFRKYDMDAKKGNNMKIFEGYGLSLHKRENNYYIRYMAGEIVSWLVEIKVTPEEARQVQISARQAN